MKSHYYQTHFKRWKLLTAGRYTFKYRQSSSPSNDAFGFSRFFCAQCIRSTFPFHRPDHGFLGTGFCLRKEKKNKLSNYNVQSQIEMCGKPFKIWTATLKSAMESVSETNRLPRALIVSSCNQKDLVSYNKLLLKVPKNRQTMNKF